MSMAELYLAETGVLLFVMGASIGSFLNVVIYRVPLGESIVFPGSHCPRCGAAIRWWNNLPILSWFLLWGRCASCGVAISFRYPAVELLNALLWLLLLMRYGFSPSTFLLLPFVSALVVLFFTDYDHKLLPDKITWPLAGAGILLAAWNSALDLAPGVLGSGTPLARIASALAGAALGYGIFFGLAVTWQMLFAREAMGGGDLKMMLGVGAFLGLGGVVITIFLASVVGTFLSLPYLLTGRWGMTRELPFGCFLAPAALFAAFYGPDLARWYLGLLTL